MSDKFYRVVKDTPEWEVGAILKRVDDNRLYLPVNDLFNKYEETEIGEYHTIVESTPDFFERVYPVDLLSKTVYKLKAEARELFSKEHTA